MKTVKIFISSPNDVKVEREIAKELIENLKIEFEEEILFDVYLYEEHHQTANRGDFQKQINKYLEQSDIAIFIIWSTLGSPMSSYDGPYSNNKGVTGTEYEFEMALKLWEKNKKPEILVYRKTKEITLPPQKESYEYKQKLEKIEKVNNFFQTWFKNQQNSIKRAFYEFKELDDLKTYLQNHIKSIILEKNYKETKITHPYKGLDSFDFEDRTIFFGRDDEIKAFMKDWNKEPFIVVFGPSGSGKSSFIKAGILPYLLEKEKGDFLVTRPVELSQNPFETLSKKLFEKYESSFNSLTYTIKDLQKRFESLDILPLHQVLSHKKFYLIIDQFEEIIIILKELQEKYLQFLQLCIKKLNISILTTIRTNSLDILEENTIFRNIDKFTYRLTFPSTSNIIHIIRKPAILANLVFEMDPVKKRRLDNILTEEVIKNVSALPLLEFALMQLEKRKVFKDKRYYLTIEAYKEIGGLQGSIATLAKQTYEELNKKEKEIFEKLLLKLVGIKNDHFILTDYIPHQYEKGVVQKFVEARLFVQESEYIRVVHEAFFKYWDFAKKVIENAKSDIIQRDRIIEAYHLYVEQKSNKKALLQGSLLVIANEILKKRGKEFFDGNIGKVSTFIKKSLNQSRRKNI